MNISFKPDFILKKISTSLHCLLFLNKLALEICFLIEVNIIQAFLNIFLIISLIPFPTMKLLLFLKFESFLCKFDIIYEE